MRVLEVTVQIVHSEEEALVLALVAAEDLDHPVNHLGSECLADGVSFQPVRGFGLLVSRFVQVKQ